MTDELKHVFTIYHNGSRWAGEIPADFSTLLKLMEVEPLDWERFGNFTGFNKDGTVHCMGNFLRISHAFSIDTDSKDIIASLATALEVNHALFKSHSYKDKPITTEKSLAEDA
jgi:hypothetical protein